MANALNLQVFFTHNSNIYDMSAIKDQVIIDEFVLDIDNAQDVAAFEEIKNFLNPEKVRSGQMFQLDSDAACIIVSNITKSKSYD